MPTISMFYGIIIRMFIDDHNPPHFHAYYQDYKAVFTFDGEMLTGKMPKDQTKLIQAWTALHRDELSADWELRQEDEPLFKIEPLR